MTDLDALFTPQPPSAPAPAPQPVVPKPLCRQGLEEFRDSQHESSCLFAASIAEIDLWTRQLYDAIDSGQLDPRPSWEIHAAEDAQRVAALVIAELRATTKNALAEPKARITFAPSASPELVRARDVRMTSREWRAAVHRGELRARKIGREYLATREDFDAYLVARQVAPKKSQPPVKRTDPATAAVDRALASGKLRIVKGSR